MKKILLIDDKIAVDPNWFNASNFTIKILPTLEITPENIKNADALWLRSMTAANATLLENSNIQFIGSATSGEDHLDIAYLNKKNIAYCTTPGSNKEAVLEYVLACIKRLMQDNLLTQQARIGVIGCGRIGSLLTGYLKHLGFNFIVNDPPRALLENDFFSTPLDDFFNCDCICLHTPLIRDGKYPTYHLINDAFLKKMKRGSILINAARGSVVDTKALLKNPHVIACLDVFENEPDIDLNVVNHCYISTPHIAGYALIAKINAAEKLTLATHQFFKMPPPCLNTPIEKSNKLISSDYDPMLDSNEMKKVFKNRGDKNIASLFRKLRENYSLR